MKKVVLLGAVIAIGLSGCSTVTDMQATGGSKADGTIHMSYEFSPFDIIKIDYDKALVGAEKRCKAWGYQSAEAFDQGFRTCSKPAAFGGCDLYRVTVQYQCLGELGK